MILTFIISMLMFASFQILHAANPFRELVQINNYPMQAQVLQIKLISEDKIMVRTNATIYIAQITDPTKSIRVITKDYNSLHDVGVSYQSKTFMYAKNQILVGDTVQGPIDINLPKKSDFQSFQIIKDIIIYSRIQNTLYSVNTTSNVVIKGPSFNQYNPYTGIIYSQSRNRIAYYCQPYIFIADLTFSNQQIIKLTNPGNLRYMKFSQNGSVISIVTTQNIFLVIWNPQLYQYFQQVIIAEFDSYYFGIYCFDEQQHCRFVASDSDNVYNFIGSWNYTATFQKVLKDNFYRIFVQLLDDKNKVISLIKDSNYFIYHVKNDIINQLAQETRTNISNLKISASTSTENIIFSGDGKIMIACVKQQAIFILKVWKGTNFKTLSCQSQINESLRFVNKYVSYSQKGKWFFLISQQKLEAYNLSTCKLINQKQLKVQSFQANQQINTIFIVSNQKLKQYSIPSFQPLQQFQLESASKPIFVPASNGQEFLIACSQDQNNRLIINKYGSDWKITKSVTLQVCLFWDSIIWAGIKYFKVICKLNSNRNSHLVTIFNLADLKILQQSSINSQLDIISSDCTYKYQISFRDRVLYYTEGPIQNLNYFQNNKSRKQTQYFRLVNSTFLTYIQSQQSDTRQVYYFLSTFDIINSTVIKRKSIRIDKKVKFVNILPSEDQTYLVIATMDKFYNIYLIIYELSTLNIMLELITDQFYNQVPPLLNYQGFLFVSKLQGKILRYDFKNIKTCFLKTIQTIVGGISVSNNGKVFMVAGITADNQIVIEYWNKYHYQLIDIYQAPNSQKDKIQIKFSMNDQTIILIQGNMLFQMKNKVFQHLSDNIQDCLFIENDLLLCRLINGSMIFATLSSNKWTFTNIQQIQLFAVSPSKQNKSVALISNKTIKIANISNQTLVIIYSASLQQSNISSVIFSEEGYILTFSQQQNSIALWSYVQCSSDRFIFNHSCICPDFSKQGSQGTCECQYMREMIDHSCNCIANSTDFNGKCQCDYARQFNGSHCVCILNSKQKQGKCQCEPLRVYQNDICVCRPTFSEIDGQCVCSSNQFIQNQTLSCAECKFFCQTCSQAANNCNNDYSKVGYLFFAGISLGVIGSFFVLVAIIKKCISINLKKRKSLLTSLQQDQN